MALSKMQKSIYSVRTQQQITARIALECGAKPRAQDGTRPFKPYMRRGQDENNPVSCYSLEIIAYLNDFALDAMPEAATRLMYLTLSLAEIAPAVENFGQPREPDTFDPFRFVPQHK